MRAVKIVAWALLGIVGLLILAAIAVVTLVDPNQFKDEIAQAVREETGRDLRLDGNLSLSLFPWLAIETGRAQLGNPQNFGPGPFVSVESADVGVKLIPLLRGRLEVRRLRLEGLQLNLLKDEQGRTNWRDLTEPEPAQSEMAGTQPSSAPTIAGLTVKNAAIDYRDLGTGSHWRISDLDVETGRLGGREPFDVNLAFTVDQGEGSAATRLKLAANVTLDTSAQQYSARDLVMDVVLRPTTADGKEQSLKLTIPSFLANLERQTLEAPQFVVQMAGAEMSGSVKGEQIVDAPKLAGALKLSTISPRDLMRKLDEEVPDTRDPKALSSLAFDSAFKATGNTVQFENINLALDDSRMTGRAGIEDLKTKALSFDLTVDQLDLDRYQEPEDKKKEKDQDEKPFELPVESLKALNARGTIAVGALTLSGIRMSAVKLTIDAKDGLVRANPSQAKLYGGAHRGNVALDARGPVVRLSVEERLSGIDFAPLFADLFDSKRLSGRGNANAVLAARGNTSDALIRSLDGRIEFDAANGAIVGTDLWYEWSRARALWKRESPPAQGSTGRTTFRTLKGTATLDDGVLTNRDLAIDMDYLKVAGEGTLNLDSQKVDYRLQTSLYRIPPDGQAAEMQNLKEADIPVRVSGTLADLKVRPDFEGLAKAQASKELGDKAKELTDKLKEKFGKWLGGQ